ncbi:MAG: hypothetical protein H6Q89_756 [Myxococcaceae bacterium]|nr:hypothetical protein [Myxococcaceae bacterium]
MKLKNLLVVTSVLAFVFGLVFLLVPYQATSLYGYTLDRESSFFPRYMGAAFLGFGLLNWYAKEVVGESVAIRAIIVGNLVHAVVGLAVGLGNAINMRGNGLVWMNVAIYAVLTVGFGYFQFVRKDVTAPRITTGPGTPIPH